MDAVLNLSHLLRTETSEARRSDYIQQAEGELLRVSDIASNTLRFHRDPYGSASFDISELIESTLSLFRARMAVSKVVVETTLSPGTLIFAPQGEIRQVIVNLIGNSLDAMPRGGRLILKVREFINHRTGKLCVRLTVADTGDGMPPDVLKRVFEAFYTTKGVTGNGLGLWLSSEIVKKCGSAMQVRSAVGRGTVFHVSLRGTEAHD